MLIKKIPEILAVLTIIVVIGVVVYTYKNQKSSHPIVAVPEQLNEIPRETNSGKIAEQVIRERSLKSTDRTVALYARKIQKTVDVQIEKNGKVVKSFTYQELLQSDDSGNIWRGLPPSIDLSPDGLRIAYSDIEGLKVLELSKGVIKVVRKHFISTDTDGGKSQYFLDPIWFPDSKYFRYSKPLYEGSYVGIADSATGEYNDEALVASPDSLEVIRVGAKTYIIYSTSRENPYGGIPGLFVAEFSSLQKVTFTNLLGSSKKDIDIKSASYDDIENSIIFTFLRGTKIYRGTISLDGNNFSETSLSAK